nr:transmembrane protein 254 isoform X1 [Oryctolagus cuniculus]
MFGVEFMKNRIRSASARSLIITSFLCGTHPLELLFRNRGWRFRCPPSDPLSPWVVLWPQSIPYESLGLLGSFTQSLVDHHHTLLHNGYWFAWMIHVAESLYAMVLCKYKGITNGRAQLLWFLQTFFFGIASLSILIAYRPKRQKQN